MRVLDKEMEMIVAREIKGLAEEIRLPIENEVLSYGCPSQHTLAREDTRFAEDVLIYVGCGMKREMDSFHGRSQQAQRDRAFCKKNHTYWPGEIKKGKGLSNMFP